MRLSRRVLARYGADALMAGQSAAKLADHLAAVLIEGGRQNEAPLLLDDICLELENRGKLSAATVTSAHPLSENSKRQLSGHLKKLNRVDSVLLTETIDSSVIGGLRVETPSRVWDQTIAGRLAQLREAFNG